MSGEVHPMTAILSALDGVNHGAGDPAWLGAVRREARERVATVDLPTTHNEEWKYTNVSALARLTVNPAAAHVSKNLLALASERTYVADAARIVFVNGTYASSLSTVPASGATVASFSTALRTHGGLLERHFNKYGTFDTSLFMLMNTAFLDDGALVVIPDGVTVDEPIQLLFISTSPDGGAFIRPRVLVIAGRSSRARIIETHCAVDGDAYVSTAVAEIVCEEGAVLNHVVVNASGANAWHISTTAVAQHAGSTYESCSVTTGGRVTRVTTHVALLGPDCRCDLNGLYVASGTQHVDHHIAIDHTAPRCASTQLYKGILGDHARAVFNGKVFVRHDAQKTDARQTNRNLMLSNDARVDAKPQLEIFADDVKCSHGATVGQLDDASLFYLKTRGIGEAAGRRLLTYGFAHEVLERIGDASLRARLDAELLSQVERMLP